MKRREFIESVGLGVASGFITAAVPGLVHGQTNTGKSSGNVKPFPKIVHHGQALGKPAKTPEGTKNIVSYELGEILQLDRTHCLLMASMDEQGGPDLCVGNDGFVFEKLSDIKAENAIPLNRVETNYKRKDGKGEGFLAKYPLTGGFIPLDARLENGRPHPGAGTGILVSECLAFSFDRSGPVNANADYNSWEGIVEIIQVKWTGEKLLITDVQKARNWLGRRPTDDPLSQFCPIGESLVAPFRFEDNHEHAVHFNFDGKAWTPTKIGPPFEVNVEEKEPSIQGQGNEYFIAERGEKNRVYVSNDGLNFKLFLELKGEHNGPFIINEGLDGNLYLACNGNEGWYRNPLLIYPKEGNDFGKGIILHDQDGVRSDKGDKLPFIDHARGSNVLLEGRWRHLICYRVCDLKERTLYGFQSDFVKKVHGGKGPIPKRATSGLYIAELMYDKITTKPFFGDHST